MKKIAIFAILLSVNLVHANDVCNEYIKQSRLYLDELYAKESKRLANDEKALRLFELKFDEFKQRQSGQEAMILQNKDEKFCKRKLEETNKLLNDLKK
ncbi:hypothetical protein [Campylobacter concisus]|uniref:hypothetical protein n=1 Tax=Campylobacter concisus TaxID=199 RepID=UPI00122CE76F|nr:hypothetical protein [Campylobacter concisus]